MGSSIVELMILMRKDSERRSEVRRAEEEQRRRDDEKLEMEDGAQRDKDEACARSQELMHFIDALVKKE
ncbi:hypothetical protein GN244_ATG11867 [Phytophthora infestans]|uniref:Uncharacterized protein n=1 Tax=Phytophthora infestans TaxID=4787 RepID=A0A833WT04_PHYIN|nr:hypothetical protein GN244_ATG11867 [Phytophthora infestans]